MFNEKPPVISPTSLPVAGPSIPLNETEGGLTQTVGSSEAQVSGQRSAMTESGVS